MESDVLIEALQSIIHPYARYGLAVALYRKRPHLDLMDEKTLAVLLAEAIEIGLGHFRMATPDVPSSSEVLHYEPLNLDALKENTKLVQSSGLAAQGKYLYPSIVSTDGDAKGTFDNALDIVKSLRDSKALDSVSVFSRSFAPTTAKINNGKRSLSEPRGTLLEAACSVITTVTLTKPAAWISGRNTGIIPDLPLEQLYDFIELFERMMTSGLEGDLMQAKLASKTPASLQPIKRVPKKAEGEPPKSEYRRPRLHNGNYPFAPQRDAAAFGAVGLLGAIGRWAAEAKETQWADKVLLSIAGNPLYIVSYDHIAQVQFGHHIVGLARNGKLSDMIRALTYETRLGSEIDNGRPSWDDPARQLFHLMASRFLQLFTGPSFRDFFATRTLYPTEVQPLFKEYFMEKRQIPADIVASAGAFGQWLNRTAFFAADAGTDSKKPKQERDKEVQKAKAKVIVNLESVAMSAKLPQDMIAQVLTQSGRLMEGDAPPEAKRFIDAVMTGEVAPEDGRNLLMAYMRLRSPSTKSKEPDPYNISTEDHSSDSSESA